MLCVNAHEEAQMTQKKHTQASLMFINQITYSGIRATVKTEAHLHV